MSLKGQRIIRGYRDSEPINLDDLTSMLIKFSSLIMQLGDNIESIDLNPIICLKEQYVIADTRIMLKD